MRSLRIICHLFSRHSEMRRNLNILFGSFTLRDRLTSEVRTRCFLRIHTKKRNLYSDSEECVINDDEILEIEHFEKIGGARNLLFRDSDDIIINELNSSASVEDVMNILDQHEISFTPEHITQIVLVLRDLQKAFYYFNGFKKKSIWDFNESLKHSEGFNKLHTLIKNKLDCFNGVQLSYLFFYIHKLGLLAEDDLMQNIALILRNGLRKDFRLDICAKLLMVIFHERSMRPFYISLEFLPDVISAMDTFDSLSEFDDLTLCLNKLHYILTDDVIAKYKNCVENLLHNQLKKTDCKTILNILLLLNYPKWRYQNGVLISKCLLMIKNDLDLFSVTEFVTLYEVFHKNQEPGELLNNIQRNAAKFMQLYEEKEFCDVDTALKLFSAFIYFSSPTQRTKFQGDIGKYLDKCDDLETLLLLKKVISHMKVSDWNICDRYWSLSLKLLEESNKFNDVIQLCQNYISFNTDIANFRHYKFEKKIFQCIEEAFNRKELISPTELTAFLRFSLKYQAKEKLLCLLIEKLENNLYHMQPIHYLQLTSALHGISSGSFPHVKIGKLRKLLNQVYTNLIGWENRNFMHNLVLVKAMAMQNNMDNYTFESLLYKFKELDYMCSKMIENLCGVFLMSNCIVPEVLNKCTEYIVNHPDNIVAFNAEKLLNICYFLAYYPLNAEKFFRIVTDIILRDQERLSGLAILQSALSLSFFNKLPSSLIKQIFSMEFMDKLDIELANCYFKDQYPQRVRSILMQLNRSVCLEYPEFNVPWFHKKYVEEQQKRSMQEPEDIPLRITEYLSEVIGKDNILENFITPYGYHIDFVVSFDASGNIVSPNSSTVKRRLALIVMKKHAYTRFYIHLKGRYQQKNRHLEMLGYEVSPIKLSEWTNLLYADERLEFLRELIGTEKKETLKYDDKR